MHVEMETRVKQRMEMSSLPVGRLRKTPVSLSLKDVGARWFNALMSP